MAALHNKTLQVAQMQGDPRPVLLPEQELQNNSIVAVPFGHELSGVFNLQSREQRSFDSAELAVLEREVSSSIVALIQTHASYEPARHSSRGYCKKHYMSEYYLPRVAEIVATRRSA